MGRSKESFNKKEKEKQRLKKRQDKEAKMEERRASGSNGNLESMLAYVDENGNLSSTPPDPSIRREINLDDIQLGAAASRADATPEIQSGVLESFFHDKGFGFIKDENRHRSVFVHISALGPGIDTGDRVSFDTEQTPKGLSAVNVVKIK